MRTTSLIYLYLGLAIGSVLAGSKWGAVLQIALAALALLLRDLAAKGVFDKPVAAVERWWKQRNQIKGKRSPWPWIGGRFTRKPPFAEDRAAMQALAKEFQTCAAPWCGHDMAVHGLADTTGMDKCRCCDEPRPSQVQTPVEIDPHVIFHTHPRGEPCTQGCAPL